MVCPVCQRFHRGPADRCPLCGANLEFLRKHPGRVAFCVIASIVLGAGMFLGLAWQVFGPMLRGWPAGTPSASFWWAFALGTFFLGFGLAARQHLASALRRLADVQN